MLYWKYVQLENWDIIQPKLNEVVDGAGFFGTGFFWNTYPIATLKAQVPELTRALLKHGWTIQYSAFILARPHGGSYLDNIHVDDMFGVAARLQLPVRNTEGSFTYFFSAPKTKIQRRLLQNGHAFWWLDKLDAKEETRVCIDRPTIIRTGEPHSVLCNPLIRDFRITLTLRLTPDPGRLLV